MAVPLSIGEYLERYQALVSKLGLHTGSGDKGEILNELAFLTEYVRQNSGGLTVPTTDIFHGGLVDYNDAATSTTPISVAANTPTVLTNDAAGGFTNRNFLPDGITDIWDSVNNQFDLSQLKLGDMIDIRLDVDVTTTAPNQLVTVYLELGQGGFDYKIPFVTGQAFKNANPHPVNRFNGIYIGDANTLDNKAQFIIETDDIATVKVNGWYCKIIRRGVAT